MSAQPTQDETARESWALVLRALELARELIAAAATGSVCPAMGREFDRVVDALKAKR